MDSERSDNIIYRAPCCSCCLSAGSLPFALRTWLLHLTLPVAKDRCTHRCTLSKMAAGLRAANQNIVFLPTACLQLLHTIAVSRPHHVIIASDFDALPDVTVLGVSAPLVASQVGTCTSSMPVACADARTLRRPRGNNVAILLQKAGQTQDHASLLVPSADIFHPTSFPLLSSLHQRAAGGLWASVALMTAAMTSMSRARCPAGPGGRSSWQSCASFMQQHADTTATQTRTAYNPLLHDFTNTSIFVGQSA